MLTAPPSDLIFQEDELPRTETRIDPQLYFPAEIFVLILRQLPFLTVVQLQLVNRSWRDAILGSSELWSSLDFSGTSAPLAAEQVFKCIEMSRNSVRSLRLSDMKSLLEQVVVERYLASTNLRESLKHLEEIHWSTQTSFFNDRTFLASNQIFSRLSSITVHIRNSPEFVSCLLHYPIPTLKDVHFDVDWFEMFRETIHYEIPIQNTTILDSIESLHIGSRLPEEKYLYRYLTSPLFGSNKWILLWMVGLQRLLSILPNLKRFCMVRIDAFAVGMGGFQNAAELDLTHLHKLETVDIQYSMVPQILLYAGSKSIREIIFVCSTELPRFMAQNAEKLWVDSRVSNQRPQIRKLVLADVAYPFLGNFALVRMLRSVSSQFLEELDLSSACYHRLLIDYCSSIYDDIDHYMHPRPEDGMQFDTDPEKFTLAHSIVYQCPNIRKLYLGNTIQDTSLAVFRQLRNLEKVDIGYSPVVTRFGVFDLLGIPYDENETNSRFVSTEEIVSRVDSLTSTVRELTVWDCKNIYTGLLDPIADKFGIKITVYSTTTFTINGENNTLDLLTHYRWYEHGSDRIRNLPELRSRPELNRSGWRSDAHWI
ncbi:hypothetical protein BZA70DRAFT_283595 [Myxozyma melibiosi]|uniref:F-box domain-containing protein n=1 Tax=Myxozyma melibiosi TaxID=54550 RepID=A0ABR1F0L0_9ASCO